MQEFDPLSPEVFVDGVDFERLASIRSEGPLCKTPTGEWYVATHAAVAEVLKDVGTFRADLAPMSNVAGLEDIPDDQMFLSEIMEPRHGKVRRLYNACLAPHRVNRMHDAVHQMIGGLADVMVAGGQGDLHDDYAAHVPSSVMAHAMGLPPEAAEQFMAWSLDGTLMLRRASPECAEGGPAIQDYFQAAVTARRATVHPPDDVLSMLVEAEIDGLALTDQEIVTQLHFMIQAGVHTTRGMLTHVLQRLLFEPATFARLRADRDAIASYVEESLRFDAPVQRTTRRCTRDTELGGHQLTEGQWVMVGIGSANRDEEVFERAAAFDIDRDDGKAHLAFGAGSHICPGATLARLEAVMCVNLLFDRVVAMAPIDGISYPPLPGNLVHAPIPATFTLA